MKKFVSLLAVVLLVTMLFPVSASAHGHSGGSTSYAICTAEDCNTTYSHRHGNTWYSGHSLNDGHEYHKVCSVSGCMLTTTHEHDGVTCFPHTANDGHSYHSSSHKSGSRHH